jgi:nucleoside-diphosphate-sugar epimerase
MKALVTGATGFIGRALSERLVSDGFELRVLARDRRRLDGLGADARVEVAEGDVTDSAAIDRAVAGVDLVFHVAGSFREADASDERYRQVNVESVRHVFAAARRHGVRRVVHTSTVGIHGSVAVGAPAAEDSPLRPEGAYEVTKAEGDAVALAEAAAGRPEVVVLRPAPVYGPGDYRLLKLFRLAARTRPVLLGDGTALYHMVHIDDLVDAYLLAAKVPAAAGQAFIVAGRERPTVNELVAAVALALGRARPPRPFHLPAAPARMLAGLVEDVCRPLRLNPPIYRRRVDFFLNNRLYDIRKAEGVLGFRPRVALEDGLRRTAEWYRAKGKLPALSVGTAVVF